MMEAETSTLANGAPLWGNLKTSIDGVSALEECLMLEQDDPRRLAWALEGTRLGLWDWDMVSGQTIFNERWAEIIGYRLEELQPTTIDTWICFVLSMPHLPAESNGMTTRRPGRPLVP